MAWTGQHYAFLEKRLRALILKIMVNGDSVSVPLHHLLENILYILESYIAQIQKNILLLSVSYSCSNVRTYQKL